MRAWPRRVKALPPVPTAFLDRDGVLNWNRAGTYVTRPGQLRLYAAAAPALRLMAAKGFRLVVLTNQSGVARGYMTMAQARAINLKLLRDLRAMGAAIDAVYFCPHAPGEGCACRKPKPGLIREATKDCPADMARSFMAGDKKSDLGLARQAGIKGRLVLTGQWRSAGAAAAKKGYRSLLALARALPDYKRKTR
jgi:histidinol-phosphate phosphatase family protein